MSKIKAFHWSVIALLVLPATALAKIDLVTMPNRDNVQLTIYNDENITMVREQRTLTLSEGRNELEFGWANTLIDPTSVALVAPEHKDKVTLVEVKYPPNTQGSAIWVLDSQVAGAIPVHIQFFTANIFWQATYLATLNASEDRMSLDGYIRVDNNSGEDYLDAQTRVIVGNLNLVDPIIDLANRPDPYGRPVTHVPMPAAAPMHKNYRLEKAQFAEVMMDFDAGMMRQKEIVKTALSEFFVYSIAGTEDLLNGWGKRLPSLSKQDIPVQSLFRYDEQRYGNSTHKLILLGNDKQHKLGEEPLPNGKVVVYRDNKKGTSIIGSTETKYIPIGSDAELDFGASSQVRVEPVLMSVTSDKHQYDKHGNINGFDRIETWEIKVNNYQLQRADIQIERQLRGSYWQLVNKSDKHVKFKQLDHDSLQYELSLAPQQEKIFSYVVTYGEGTRQDVYANKGE